VIVAIGDSITAGQGLHPASAWPYQIKGHQMRAHGVPGDTTRLGLERFPQEVQSVLPTAVVIQFGHNDCNRWETDRGLPRVSTAAFASNLVEMVMRCRTFDAFPLLCSLTPSHRSEAHAHDTLYYDGLVRMVAMETDVPLIDVREAFGDDEGLLLDDGLHLSIEGHLRYAGTVQSALDEFFRL
jgi:lysophospholipase L1-like esterase